MFAPRVDQHCNQRDVVRFQLTRRNNKTPFTVTLNISEFTQAFEDTRKFGTLVVVRLTHLANIM